MSYKLSRDGFMINRKNISTFDYDLIKKDLIIKPKISPQFDNNVKFKIYKETPEYYITPKFWGLEKICSKPTIHYYKTTKVEFKMNKTLTEQQLKIYYNTIKNMYYKSENNVMNGKIKKIGGAVICARTGLGKTILGLKIISTIGVKTIIFVHTEILQKQWIENIEENFDNKNLRIGVIGGTNYKHDKFDADNYDIIVAMVQTVMKEKIDYSELLSDYGLVVFDETHHYSSKEFNKVTRIINLPYTLGLTATLERSDKTEYIIPWFLGNISYRQHGTVGYCIDINIIKFKKDNSMKFKEYKNYRGIMMPKMLSNLALLDERNKIIVNVIDNFLTEHPHQVMVVFSCRVGHLLNLRKMIGDKYSIGYVIGEKGKKENAEFIKSEELENLENKRIIFAIENLKEGFNVKSIQSVFLTMPSGNIYQATGRMLRKRRNEYKTNPTIFEIFDDLSIFINMHYKRYRQYKASYLSEKGSKIIYYDCNDETKFKLEYIREYVTNKTVKTIENEQNKTGFIDNVEIKTKKNKIDEDYNFY